VRPVARSDISIAEISKETPFHIVQKISAAIGHGRCVKYSVTLLGYILVPCLSRHLPVLPVHRHCFFGGKYILACWIHCVDPVIWFVWSAVASRHNRAIGMTACERTGSASFTVKEPGREEQPDGGSYWSPEFCVSEYVPDAAGVAGVTHGSCFNLKLSHDKVPPQLQLRRRRRKAAATAAAAVADGGGGFDGN